MAIIFGTRYAILKEKYQRAEALTGGNARNGRAAIDRYGCAACHAIPGTDHRGPAVGPPLEGIGSRGFVAGVIKNDPENLIRWIINPPAVDPQTAMPNVGVTETDARDIAAYLYTLD